jgi:hypothetical protein
MTVTTANRPREMLRWAGLAAAVYVVASLVALSLPALLGIEGKTLTVIGGAVMLFLIGFLPAALVARLSVGVALAAMVTAAMVLAAQVVLVLLGVIGIPGLVGEQGAGKALIDAGVFTLYALIPAAAAGILTAAFLRVWRNRHRLRSTPQG